MRTSPFRDARRRIEWAKEDIADFKTAQRTLLKVAHYARVVELDDEGAREIHKIKLTKPIPEALTSKTSKALEGLRSALDLSASAIATSLGISGGDVHFPFCKSVGDMKSRLGSACKDFPQEITALFSGFQPYKGGDDLLWALNELCNGSKHRIIIPVGTAVGGVRINRAIMTSGPAGGYLGSPRWDSEKDEMVIGAVSRGSKFDYDLDVAIAIAFGKVEIVGGQPVAPVLDALLSKVSGIVSATETEARRIGLVK